MPKCPHNACPSFRIPNFRIDRLLVSYLLIVLSLFVCKISFGQTNQVPDRFTSLFNGSDLEGWTALKTQDPRKFRVLSNEEQSALMTKGLEAAAEFWRVENGELVNDGKGPYLTTLSEYRDFELMIDYKTVAGADSGVYLKATPQVQIWDTTEAGGKWHLGAKLGSGGLWNNSKGQPGKDPIVNADNPFGQWNKLRIQQIGSRTSVWLNKQLVVDHAVMENFWDRKIPLAATGPIQLQTHGGEIRWRNIFIRQIEPEECNEILAAHAGENFESVFNGNDFEGWAGKIENYEVHDGVLRCKPKKGGTVFTKEQFSDFAVQFQFRLPAGGNNGLAIRYPGGDGSIDTAYAGMCELQVLDSEHSKFQNLDSRQYHGSAYGIAAAHRGYLRNTDQWNFQKVTVVGSTITVELNGTIILNSDLSTVKEFLGDKPHPGVTRTSGHFGFAGHNDPVEFKDVKIKRIGN